MTSRRTELLKEAIECLKEIEQIQESIDKANEEKQYFCFYEEYNNLTKQNKLIVIARGKNTGEVLTHLLEKFTFTSRRGWIVKEIVKNKTDTIDFFAWGN